MVKYNTLSNKSIAPMGSVIRGDKTDDASDTHADAVNTAITARAGYDVRVQAHRHVAAFASASGWATPF